MNARAILEVLDTLAIWRRLTPLPNEVEELRRRIEALEARLGAAAAGGLAQCPMCNSLQFKRIASKPHPTWGHMAAIKLETYQCQQCGHSEDRERDESAPPRR